MREGHLELLGPAIGRMDVFVDLFFGAAGLSSRKGGDPRPEPAESVHRKCPTNFSRPAWPRIGPPYSMSQKAIPDKATLPDFPTFPFFFFSR